MDRDRLRVPRLFLPEQEYDLWAASEPSPRWEENGEDVHMPSHSVCVAEGEATEERLAKIAENMHTLLENGDLTRLWKGLVLVLRATPKGERRGILAAVDLEEYAPEGSKTALIRPACASDPGSVARYLAEREHALLELPRTVLCYRDRRNRILRALDEEELEPLYEFSAEKVSVKGFFVSDLIADEVLEDLLHYAEPCFGVLSGESYLTAAKAHWDRVKRDLSPEERETDPARFSLAEFVNLCDPAVEVAFSEKKKKKDDLPALFKSAKLLPAGGMKLCGERFVMEAREIAYD